MAGQLETYKTEILNFLRTCTIKFEPFAWIMGTKYMNQYGLEDPHQKWNPYYINMAGEYAEGDEIMSVYSVEEGTNVPFTKAMLQTHPKTASLYKLPNTEYNILEEKYPKYRGLIRTIAYPAGSIEDIIAAPNLELLAYDPSLLYVNEQESLILTLKEFLAMCRTRWWIVEYTYEDMFAITFWAMLWQMLPLVLLTQRFKNIRTPYAHPFHIWEYLQSNGLGDYRDVLSDKQSHWLYRNIHYIEKNKGKQSNLKILAENLLEEVAVSLVKKDMYQETETRWEPDLKPTPVFRSFDFVADKEIKDEDLPTITRRLKELGVEPNDSEDYIKDKEDELGVQPNNILPTKIMELRKDPVNMEDEALLNKFLMDTFVYRMEQGDLKYEVFFNDPPTMISSDLHIHDVYYLFNYCMWRSCCSYHIPEHLPHLSPCSMAFQKKRPQRKDIREGIYYNEKFYNLSSFIDVDDLINRISWWDAPFLSDTDFATIAVEQFLFLKGIKKELDQSNLFLYHSAMANFFFDVLIHRPVTTNEKGITYKSWFETKVPLIWEMILKIEESEKPCDGFERVARTCFNLMFPLEKVEGFTQSVRVLDRLYNSIRDLFIQLGSYNILYLEMEREERQYLRMEEPDFIPAVQENTTFDGVWDYIFEDPIFKRRINQTLAPKELHLDFTFSHVDHTYKVKHTIWVDFEFISKLIQTKRWLLYRDFGHVLTKQNIQQHRQMYTAGVSCRMRINNL